MGVPSKVLTNIADFQGMATNVDPSDIPPGVSEVQVNVCSVQRGQIEVRRGLKSLTFDEEDD